MTEEVKKFVTAAIAIVQIATIGLYDNVQQLN